MILCHNIKISVILRGVACETKMQCTLLHCICTVCMYCTSTIDNLYLWLLTARRIFRTQTQRKIKYFVGFADREEWRWIDRQRLCRDKVEALRLLYMTATDRLGLPVISLTAIGGVELKRMMSKDLDFLKFYQSGRRLRRTRTGGVGRGSLLVSVLLVMSLCLGASGEVKIYWYISESELIRLNIPELSEY